MAGPVLPHDDVADLLPQRRFSRQAPSKRQDVNWHGQEVEARTKRRYTLSWFSDTAQCFLEAMGLARPTYLRIVSTYVVSSTEAQPNFGTVQRVDR